MWVCPLPWLHAWDPSGHAVPGFFHLFYSGHLSSSLRTFWQLRGCARSFLHFLNTLLGFLLITSHVLLTSVHHQSVCKAIPGGGRAGPDAMCTETDKCLFKKITANLPPQQEPGEVNCMELRGWTSILKDHSVIHSINIYWELLAYYLLIIFLTLRIHRYTPTTLLPPPQHTHTQLPSYSWYSNGKAKP